MKTNFKDKNGKYIFVGDTLFDDNYKCLGEVVYSENSNKYFVEGEDNFINIENLKTENYNASRDFILVDIETFINKISFNKRTLFAKDSLKEFLKEFDFTGINENNQKFFTRKEKNIVIEVKLNKYLKLN